MSVQAWSLTLLGRGGASKAASYQPTDLRERSGRFFLMAHIILIASTSVVAVSAVALARRAARAQRGG
jgi:hypothetical protein